MIKPLEVNINNLDDLGVGKNWMPLIVKSSTLKKQRTLLKKRKDKLQTK